MVLDLSPRRMVHRGRNVFLCYKFMCNDNEKLSKLIDNVCAVHQNNYDSNGTPNELELMVQQVYPS